MENIKTILTEWSFPIVMMITNIAIAVGAILAGLSAWGAWKGWEKEMRGRTEYKLVLNLQVELYKYHGTVQKCLSKFSLSVDALERLRPPGGSNMFDLDKRDVEIYKRFLTDLATQQDALYKNLLLAEIVYPEKFADLSKQLFNTVSRLEHPFAVDSNDNLLYSYDWILTPPENGLDEVIYDKKEISNEIQKCVEKIEAILKSKLKSGGLGHEASI